MVQLKKGIRCVIFDCDGVLIDSEKLCCKALVNVFSQYSDSVNFEQCMAHFKGGKVADILTHTKKQLGIEVPLDDIEPLYREQVKILFREELHPTQGIHELLGSFSERGVEFCAISNSPKEKIINSLELTGLFSLFKGKIFSAFDANSWKPDPDLLLYAAMSMGYAPHECLYIDDTVKGVETGINAGIKTIHFKPNLYGEKYDNDSVVQITSINDLNQFV